MTQEVKTLSIVGAATVVILAGAVIMLSGNSTNKPSDASSKADPKVLVRSDSNKIGSSSAKVILVEFGDFQCPSCAAAHPVVKEIIATYGNDLQFVYRNFPLPIHSNAQAAAQAAEAAGAQGKYWEMHGILFENQNQWASISNPTDTFTEYAKSLGLDTTKFKKDLDDNRYADKIQSDVNDGVSIGVSATPTFYLNGVQTVGVPNVADLKSKIDALLK